MNLVDLLKDCLTGTEFYTIPFGTAEFIGIINCDDYPILIRVGNSKFKLTSDGKLSEKGECIIFPEKDQRSWENWKRPFKEWDLIYNELQNELGLYYKDGDVDYITCCIYDNNVDYIATSKQISKSEYVLATKDQNKLFNDVLSNNSFYWNNNTKTLKKVYFDNGDIIYTECKFCKFISIYKEIKNSKIFTYCDLSIETKSVYVENVNGLADTSLIVDQRLATPEEIQFFITNLINSKSVIMRNKL